MRALKTREDPGGRKSRKKRRVRNVVLAWVIVLSAMAGLMAGGIKLFLSMGYRHLHDSAAFAAPQLPDAPTADAGVAGSRNPADKNAPDSDGRETPGGTPASGAGQSVPGDGEGASAEDASGGGGSGEDSGDSAGGRASGESLPKLKEGQIRRGDRVYEYIDGILTFLVLGIDIDGPVERNKDLVSGGQSDAIFLVVMNPDTKKISLIGVNRDTMVEILMVGLGANGENLTTTAEISVQHGFGDGLNQSCELTRDAVSRLFYNLPIHGYISFNMGGMAALNDAVGSVRLTVLEDMTEINPAWYLGADVTLTGRDAYEYVHYRNVNVFESARNRLARQKQYLSVFAGTALAEIKKDITLPVSLYQAFKPYTVTDLELDEISYLASQLTSYKFDENAIYTMEGTTVQGARFEEFYPDQKALQELILKIFYREIDPNTGRPM